VTIDAWAVFDDLVRLETRLYNDVNDRLRTECGLSLGQFEFLRLVGARAGVRVVDLAGAVAIAVGAASKGVDRLEAAGLLRRTPNPANRRSSLLELTDEGSARLAAARPVFEAAVTHRLEPLGPAELTQAVAALRVLRQAIEAAGAGVPTG
jgi:DNA-binding MarR family transcriptional regulator